MRSLTKHSIFLLLLVSTITVYGITGGPTQPEFNSFEPVDVTDMVNLNTGDFTYVLPLGDVKTPNDVGYPIVLSYHAGIQNEQAATWVGLGWDLNVGSINRNVRGSPDDFMGVASVSRVYNKGDESWTFGLGGGWGPMSVSVGWSNKGFQGVTSVGLGFSMGPLSIGAGYNPQSGDINASANINAGPGNIGIDLTSGTTTVGLGYGLSKGAMSASASVGLTFGPGMSPKFSASASVGSPFASMTMSSAGGVNVSVGGASMGSSSMAISSKGLNQWSSGFGAAIPLPAGFHIDFSYSRSGWNFNLLQYSPMYGYLYQSPYNQYKVSTYDKMLSSIMGNHSTTFLYTVQEDISLGLNKSRAAAGSNGGMHFVKNPSKLEALKGVNGFNFSAQDLYSISGQGISGVFKPVAFNSPKYARFESGNSDDEGRFDATIGDISTSSSSENVQFTKYYNKFNYKFSPEFSDGMVFKMLGETALNLVDSVNSDIVYKNLDLYFDKSNNISYEGGDVSAVTGTRIDPIFGKNKMFSNLLCGFVVTDQEGKKYYYTYPLYNYQDVQFINSQNKVPEKLEKCTDCSYFESQGAYATSWLLESVTGPDYVRRKFYEKVEGAQEGIPTTSEDFLPHEGDWGYWVTFRYEYGDTIKEGANGIPVVDKTSQPVNKASFSFIEPFYDDITKPVMMQNDCEINKTKYSSSYGFRDITYLKSIETASEVAFFNTSERLDGYGMPYKNYPQIANVQIVDKFKKNTGRFFDSKEKSGNIYCVVPVGNYINKQPELLPVKSDVGKDLNKCFSIVLSGKDLAWWRGQKNGDILGELNFEYNELKYKSTCFGNDKTRYNAKGKLVLRKDTLGCGVTGSILDSISSGMSKPLDIMNPVRINDINYSVNYAKCFYARPTHDSLEIFLIGYDSSFVSTVWNDKDDDSKVDDGEMVQSEVKYRTRVGLGETHFRQSWGWWSLIKRGKYDNPDVDIVFTKGYLNNSYNRYENANPIITRYLKKLDNIEWYSKSRYPQVTGMVNPNTTDGDEYYTSGKPTPYRKVNLDYSYDLAKNSPNSKGPGKGRLTLKSVTVQADDEDYIGLFHSMPPYYFGYQGAEKEYLGHKYTDDWGMRKTDPKAHYNDPQEGVCWNLNRIALPSGGIISVNYERDFMNSELGTILNAKQEYPCDKDSNFVLDPYLNDSDYFYSFTLNTTPSSNFLSSVKLPATDENFKNIKPGMYMLCHIGYTYAIPDPQTGIMKVVSSYSGLFSIFKIKSVNSDGTIEFNVNLFPWFCEKNIGCYTWKLYTVFIMKKMPAWAGNVRVTSLLTDNMYSKNLSSYSYDLGGTCEILPLGSIPSLFNYSYGKHGAKNIQALPFANDFSVKYNTGNSQISYPSVSVCGADPNDPQKLVAGKTTYHFYTPDNAVMINGNKEPIIKIEEFDADLKTGTSTTKPVKVKKITDRSSIVGMVRMIEFFNNSGTAVKTTYNNYLFSEELSSKAGVYYKTTSGEVSSDKPLGLINERSVTMSPKKTADAGSQKTFQESTVVDIVISKPFLYEVKEVLDNVSKTTLNGFFNARSGGAMGRIEENTTPDGVKKRVTVDIPYEMTLMDKIQSSTDAGNSIKAMTRLNTYSLKGAQFVDSISTPSLVNTPADISLLSMLSSPGDVKSASANVYYLKTESANSNISYSQERFLLTKQYVWKNGQVDGISFPSADRVDNNWKMKSYVRVLDKYSRPLSEENALGNVSSVTMHPKLNLVASVLQNATIEEAGVLTGDYIDPDTIGGIYYLDYQNGWEHAANVCKLYNDPNFNYRKFRMTYGSYLFGYNCIKINGSNAIARNFKIQKKNGKFKNYKLSMWVAVLKEPLNIKVSYYKINTGSENKWPLLASTDLTLLSTSPITKTVGLGGYELVTLDVPASSINVSNNVAALRLEISTVGTAKNMINDIRFYPENSLISSYYYDQELAVPITTVDNNNIAHYYHYDAFGRLDTVYNTKYGPSGIVKTAEYKNVEKQLKVLYPNGGETVPRNGDKILVEYFAPYKGNNYTLNISFVDNSNSAPALITNQTISKEGLFSAYVNMPSTILGKTGKIKISYDSNVDYSDNWFNIGN